jgi:hypothetical protein
VYTPELLQIINDLRATAVGCWIENTTMINTKDCFRLIRVYRKNGVLYKKVFLKNVRTCLNFKDEPVSVFTTGSIVVGNRRSLVRESITWTPDMITFTLDNYEVTRWKRIDIEEYCKMIRLVLREKNKKSP